MKRRTITDPNGKPVVTIFIRLFGIPMWIESGSEKAFVRNVRRTRRVTRHADKIIQQLHEIKQLLDEIESSTAISRGNQKAP